MRTPRRSALILLVLAATAAGCGGEHTAAPDLPAQLADRLADRSDAVALRLGQGDGCGARAAAETLQADAIAAVNAGRIPARFQEELVSSVAALVASIECAPAEDEKGKRNEKHEHDDEEGEDEDGKEGDD